MALPWFGLSSDFTPRAVLSSLGMPSAFDPEAANLSGIAHLDDDAPNTFVYQVYHKTDITVDEE